MLYVMALLVALMGVSLALFLRPGLAIASVRIAERLGYGPDARLLIIHSDDIGMSYAANVAARDLLERGIAKSASVMVPCPWAFEFFKWYRENPQYDVGIHLTLTSEWKTYRWRPLSSREEVPGLFDGDGFMWGNVPSVALHATADEVKIEAVRQVEQAFRWGVRPTHLDMHMGTPAAMPAFLESYMTVAREYSLIPMLINPTPERIEELKRAGYVHASELGELMARPPVPKLDALMGSASGGDYTSKKAAVYDQLRALGPGLSMLIIHPAIDTPEMRVICGSWQERYWDYRIFMEDETERLIEDLGIRVVTWREVAALISEP